MKTPSSVYITKESDLFVSDIPIVGDSQEHKRNKRIKRKHHSNGTEDTTSDSEASQSLLKVRKKKYSEMLGELHFKNDLSTVKKKKKLSVDFLTQEIFKQLSEISTDSPSKNEKEQNMNDVQNIKQEISLNSTDDLHDVSIEHSPKKKKKDMVDSSNLQCSDENFGISCRNSTPKKKKHKEKNGTITTDDLHDVSIEHSTKKKKKVKTDTSNLQYADENSSFSCSPPCSSHSNEKLHHSFDISDNSRDFTELDESEMNLSYRKHKKKIKHEHNMENDGHDMNETDDFFCQFCQSSFSNISRNGNTSLDSRDISSSRIGDQTSEKNVNTNKIKKKKREKSAGKASAKGNKESVLDLLKIYLDNKSEEDSSFSDRVDDTTNNTDLMTVDGIDSEKKTKRKKYLNASTTLNGNDPDKATSTSGISNNVCDDSVDSKGNLNGNWPTDDIEKKKKRQRKKYLNASITLNGNDPDKALDTSTSDMSSDVCDNSVDSKGNLDGNWPTVDDIDTEKRKKKPRKKYLIGSTTFNGNNPDDILTSDLSSDICDNSVDRKRQRKKYLHASTTLNGNDPDKALDTSTSDTSSDVCDNSVHSKGNLDGNCSVQKMENLKYDEGDGISNNSKGLGKKINVDFLYSSDSDEGVEDDQIDLQKVDEFDWAQKLENISHDESGDSKKVKANIYYSSDSDEGVEDEKVDLQRRCLKGLVIEVDFPIPELHKICNRASKPTPQQRSKLAQHNIIVKTGKFVKAEDKQIKENWQKFIQMYNLDNIPEGFFSLDKRIISVKEKQNFLFFLAQGLNERTPFSVYQRFKLLMGQIKRGRFTNDEDNYIQKEVEENRGVRNYIANIALHLNRSFHSVTKRIQRLKQQHTRKIRWRRTSNMAAFIKYLLKVTGTDPDDIAQLKDRHISSKEWNRLSKKLDNVPPRILMRVWLEKFHPMLFIPKDRCDMRKVKLKLVKLLFENNEYDWRAVNWTYYASHFEGLTAMRIYSLLKILITSKVPPTERTNLKECLEILQECTIYDLPPHFIYKVKYVDGKIVQPMKK